MAPMMVASTAGMQATPGGEIEVEVAARAGAVGDAWKRDLEHQPAHGLGRAQRPPEKLDQIGHECRLADPNPHPLSPFCRTDLAHIMVRRARPEMTESADSYEAREQTDGRPPTKKGRPPARQDRRCSHRRNPAQLDTTPERVTKVLRLGLPSTSVHRSRAGRASPTAATTRAAAHPSPSGRTYSPSGRPHRWTKGWGKGGFFRPVTSELDG